MKDKNPLGSKKYPYLRGDNRGFDPFSSSYRTQTKVDTNFTNLSGKSSPSIKGNSSTGTSMRCTNGDCENGEEKTASTDGIEIIKDKENDSTLKWRVKHKVGVPFGKTYPSIWYYYEATVTDAPTVHIEGAHDRAPNHELYIAAQNSDDVMPLMQYEIGNESYFYLLLPGSPQKYFNVTI